MKQIDVIDRRKKNFWEQKHKRIAGGKQIFDDTSNNCHKNKTLIFGLLKQQKIYRML